MSKWKNQSVKPQGALRGHFLTSSGWKNEAQRREPALRATQRVGTAAETGPGKKRGLPPSATSDFGELSHRVSPASQNLHQVTFLSPGL